MSKPEYKPTKEQFEDYVHIRNIGFTNMWMVNRVVAQSGTGLTINNCLYIMENFDALAKEYDVKV